jgi:hypothetical protein
MLKTILIRFSPLWRYATAHNENRVQVHQTDWRASPSTGSKARGSSSGSNDPIGDLEAQVEQLRTELHHRNSVWVEDGQRINELRTDIRHLQDELAE